MSLTITDKVNEKEAKRFEEMSEDMNKRLDKIKL